MGNIVAENLCNVRNHGLKPVFAKASSRGDMRILWDMGDRSGVAGEMWSFTWHTETWCAIPIVTLLLFMALLITFGSAPGVGPFTDTLF